MKLLLTFIMLAATLSGAISSANTRLEQLAQLFNSQDAVKLPPPGVQNCVPADSLEVHAQIVTLNNPNPNNYTFEDQFAYKAAEDILLKKWEGMCGREECKNLQELAANVTNYQFKKGPKDRPDRFVKYLEKSILKSPYNKEVSKLLGAFYIYYLVDLYDTASEPIGSEVIIIIQDNQALVVDMFYVMD